MSWSELVKHPYIIKDPKSNTEEDQMHLSFSEVTGHYAVDEESLLVDNLSILIKQDPHKHLNEKNAIMLNVKNP